MKQEKNMNPFSVILLFYIVNFIITYILVALKLVDENFTSPIVLLEYTFLAYFTCILLRNKFKGQLKDFKDNFKKNLKSSLNIWLKGFGLMIIANLLINLVIMNKIAPNEETNRSILEGSPMIASVYMCLIGPFIEEMLFRLNFKDFFKSKRTYILATGIIFGAMHIIDDLSLLNLLYLIPYSILGLTFSTCFYESKNVLVSTSIHILHNSLSVLIILLGI